jgi:hypothetical protein
MRRQRRTGVRKGLDTVGFTCVYKAREMTSFMISLVPP